MISSLCGEIESDDLTTEPMKDEIRPETLDEKVERLENMLKNIKIALERVKKQREEQKKAL